jgi:hypothetical protein
LLGTDATNRISAQRVIYDNVIMRI